MGFMGTVVDRTHPVCEFRSREWTIGLDHPFLACQPLGLDRIEPRTLTGQEAGEQAHALAGQLDVPVVLAQPSAHDLGVMPGGVVPDQQHGAFAACLRLLGTPTQEVDGDRTDRPAIDEAQPHLLAALGGVDPAARQQAIAGQRLGIGIITRDRLLDQAQRVRVVLSGVQGRTGQSTPPDLILEAQ